MRRDMTYVLKEAELFNGASHVVTNEHRVRETSLFFSRWAPDTYSKKPGNIFSW